MDDLPELDRLWCDGQTRRLTAGRLEQIVDHGAKLICVAQRDAEVLALLGGDVAGQPVEQDADELVDRNERCPELVRDVGEKLVFDLELLAAQLFAPRCLASGRRLRIGLTKRDG